MSCLYKEQDMSSQVKQGYEGQDCIYLSVQTLALFCNGLRWIGVPYSQSQRLYMSRHLYEIDPSPRKFAEELTSTLLVFELLGIIYVGTDISV